MEFNKTYVFTIEEFGFGGLPTEKMIDIFSDGRVFSHFIEHWLPTVFPLNHVSGCKSYDHTHVDNPEIKYDQKTFTHRGCYFCPSNMLGEGRSFNSEIFLEKSKKLIYIIVSNCEFPIIRVKFVQGEELATMYPRGKIPLKDFNKFFA